MNGRTILLVEDNSNDEILTVRALTKSKVANRIVVARDGAEAIEMLLGPGAFGPASGNLPELVLLDLKLPKVDGLEVLRRIRADERTSMLPVVILTSSGEEADLVHSYSAHANGYVRKPIDFAQFIEAVRAIGLFWLVVNHPAPTPAPV